MIEQGMFGIANIPGTVLDKQSRVMDPEDEP